MCDRVFKICLVMVAKYIYFVYSMYPIILYIGCVLANLIACNMLVIFGSVEK